MSDKNKIGPGEEPAAETYDHGFFLVLAIKGKDEWNAWRRDPANKDVSVIFRGVDFSKTKINFEGFEFGDRADFSACRWASDCQLMEGFQTFNPGRAFFRGAVFGELALFTGADFGDFPNLSGATFGGLASFACASFGFSTHFDKATFGGSANFVGATFLRDTFFDQAHFQDDVDFTGVSGKEWAIELEKWLLVSREQFRAALETHHMGLWELYRSWPDRLSRISFRDARFDGEARFSGRIFGEKINFTGAHFYFPPFFDTMTNATTAVTQIDFTGAYVGFARHGKLLHWTENSRVPIGLRAFRRIAEETKNHDLERDLYIEERKAERGIRWRQLRENMKKQPWANWPRNAQRLFAHVLWMFVMLLYWALADYGRSFVLPFAWLVASVFFFRWRYADVLEPLMPKSCPLGNTYEHAVDMLALGNAVPLVGPLTIDAETKKFLFCAGDITSKCLPIPPEGFQLLVIGQNLLSIILVFFIGLALRNYFKTK
jgi:hypothetical protein